jgi:hypothetical protein
VNAGIRGAVWLWLWALAACGSTALPPTRQPVDPAVVYPGTLLAPEALPPNVQWRQQITAYWPEGQRSFDVVFSKDGAVLQLIGLSPLGMPGFVLRLQGGKITVENRTGQEIPFSPRYVLLDAQRAFFPWFPESSAQDGTRQATRNGETITEYWQRGRLQRRSFQRLDAKPAGEIVVTYSNWASEQDAPGEALLVNNWVGYRLRVVTQEQTRTE